MLTSVLSSSSCVVPRQEDMAAESAVKVCVRVRPVVAREERAASENAESVQLFWKTDKKSVRQIDDGNSSKCFNFDRVFTAEESTSQLYQDIAKPLVVSTVEGYNGTIFAYGQTSSGKTFTMMGCDSNPGVIPLAVDDVFQTIKNFPNKEFLLRVSYMEIYNETVTDLLVDSWKRKPLEVRETINKTIYVADLTEELVTSSTQALAWIRKGEKNRHYGKTKMNQRSSRSHTIFRMILESRERGDPASGENADGAIIVSHLNLVDLAGSERASQTGAEGARFKEGCNINLSLFTLGQVIKKLTDESQKGFTNYRDSKLTRILQNSLGGNAKTVIISTITPVSLDETLSTLQFASTAKKMKNDPHVTEVSDDGALLKRYRNEIVDLKRRLHEVSSVTQTTVTEKEVLSQLLQEKDQLRREQEDRIRNLTKLLVTSSNLVHVPKMPKRRVTWGGKLVEHSHPSACDDGICGMNMTFGWKRKADRSCSTDLSEADEDFYSHWGIPEEPSDEMEMSQSSVTVRSFGDSPRDLVSPEQIVGFSEKISNLDLQLEIESQQREEAVNVEILDGQVEELQRQVQTEALQKQVAVKEKQATEVRLAEVEVLLKNEVKDKLEALEKMQTMEQRLAGLEMQLQSETQQKLDALLQVQAAEQNIAELKRILDTKAQQKLETTDMLELKVSELERQSEKQKITESDQMREDFAECVLLCETLASEKEKVVAERDRLKWELEMIRERTQSLEKEKASLFQELKETRDLDEFKSLEDKFTKEHETELQNEISSLKKEIESSEHQLQMTLTASKEKMEAELNTLSLQLEMERSRYRKMQSDLQKELNVAFDENVKLNALLDGKVPKNLLETVELERTVASLKNELAISLEAEKELRSQLEEQTPVQTLKDQIGDLTEELQVITKNRDNLQSGQAQREQEAEQFKALLQALKTENVQIQAQLVACARKENELNQQCADVTKLLNAQHAEQEQADSEKSLLVVSLEEKDTKLKQMTEALRCAQAEKEALISKQSVRAEEAGNTPTEILLRTVKEELKEQKQRNSDLMKTSLEKESELKEHILRLSQELKDVLDEGMGLQRPGTESSTEEVERLLTVVACLTTERDQLKQDLQDNVEMAIENQEELRTVLEKNREQVKQIKLLKSENVCEQDKHPSEMGSQLEELQRSMKDLTEELQHVRAEKDQLLSEKESSTEKMEKLQCEVTAVSEQRNRVHEVLEELKEEKKKLQAELEEKIKMMTILHEEFTHTQAERDSLFSKMANSQSFTEELEKLQSRLTALSEERDQLQEIVEGLREEKKELRAQLEEKIEMIQLQEEARKEVNQMKAVLEENEKLILDKQKELEVLKESRKLLEEEIVELRSQMLKLQSSSGTEKQLTEELECLKADRECLLAERTAITRHSKEELEKLQSRLTVLSEERDQLQEMLREKQELGTQLYKKTEMLEAEIGELNTSVHTITEQKRQLEEHLQQLLEKATSTEELLKAVKDDLHKQRNLNSELEKISLEKMCSLDQKITDLANNLEIVEAERNFLLSEKENNLQNHKEEMEKLQFSLMALSQKNDLLQEVLVGLREEKEQLGAQLQEKINMRPAFQEKFTQQELLSMQTQTEKEEQEAKFQQEDLQEELQKQKERRALAEVELDSSQQFVSEANASLSALRQQLNNLEQRPSTVREKISRLQDSASHLDEAFGKFQQFTQTCLTYDSETPEEVMRVQCSLKHTYLTSHPKSVMVAYGNICQLGLQTWQSFIRILAQLQMHASGFVKISEVVLNKDLAVFEESRLQDLLLSRVGAPKYSVNNQDFHSLWNQRLSELLVKHQLYQQKMESILEMLWANLTSYLSVRRAEIIERVHFKEALQAGINQTVFNELECILSQEAERRRSVIQNVKRLLQVIYNEHNNIFEELKQLDTQRDSQLEDEKRKNLTLLRELEGTPLKTESSLLMDYKQLALQLQQAVGNLKALREHMERLEEARAEAKNTESNHKRAIQLLQTELLDSRVLVKEKENAILTLRVKLEESEKKASPSAAELENLRSNLFEMEVKFASVTDEHHQELEKMKMVLSVKEESLRKLKQDLRSQQKSEESFLTGKELHARLTNPKGPVIQSSSLLEKTKLEEKVKQLHLRITELESLVSSQQAETNKWKNRAISLKGKSKVELDKQSPPCTPKKRGLPSTSDSTLFFNSPKKNCLPAKKFLDSSRKFVESPCKPVVAANLLLDSPKSRFFDAGECSELLSRSCPKQFFDNSDLGIKPETSQVPAPSDEDAAGSDKLDFWQVSPKEQDYCKPQ
ncbi:centromere-associated protein E isoform X4 [Girardinichthys multiradiatus]|uniref:centromere-associated protein E isoform X4 n=1 Tax=Girardinichthys multiradiatus TaxID=208333 RepID=UPI001FAC4716|nr:centromere-associated protein E isoform X4 [Girardinichthys multiradiatus]